MKKTAIISTAIFLVTALFAPVLPVNAAGEVYIKSNTAVVIDAESGTVLFNKNMDRQMHPASITKIMTAMLAMESLSTDTVLTASHNAVYSLPYNTSHIALYENEQLTLHQALYALGIESANDAANVIAEHISGSNAAFGALMTERARQTGAYNTTFLNPHGLPEDGHMTTAYDMALITREAIKIPGFTQYFSTNRFDMGPTNERNEERQFWNSNDFVNGYEACEGLVMTKNGWTEEARHTLVTVAQRNGRTLICVVMYSEHQQEKYEDTRALLDMCFADVCEKEITAEKIKESLPQFISTASGDTSVSKDELIAQSFNAVLPAESYADSIVIKYGEGKLSGDGSILSFTVEAFYQKDGSLYKCGESEAGVIVNPGEDNRAREKVINTLKIAGLTLANVFLWLLVIRVVFVILKQLVIIENRRRIRKRRRKAAMAKRRKYRQSDYQNRQ